MWRWRRTGAANWANRVKIEVLHRAKLEKNALRTVKRGKANWIGNTLLRNCLLNMALTEK
jgi:hypothetical protein